VQTVSDEFLAALSGSHTPALTVDAWYDGELVLENVPVNSGSVTVDGSRTIAGSLTLTSVSEDGSLVPDRWDAPLAPYGSQLHVRAGVRYGSGSTDQVSLGWYRIDSADPQEFYAPYTVGTDVEWVCRGMQVTTQSSDRMSLVDDARFLSPEVPASTLSVVAEIKRLVQGLVPVGNLSSVTDAAIPASIAYQTSRVQAIQDLADVLGAVARIDPDGALELIPKAASTTPVWTVSVVERQVIDWSRKLDRADLYNGVVTTGQKVDGTPVQASTVETNGPLRWDGPLGRIPFGHNSPLITTDTAAKADSETRLTRLIRERVAPITVTCTPNPALEWGDCVRLVLPNRELIGTVRSITWPLPATSMTMVVLVPRTQLWGV
jgi:hypothetical protein